MPFSCWPTRNTSRKRARRKRSKKYIVCPHHGDIRLRQRTFLGRSYKTILDECPKCAGTDLDERYPSDHETNSITSSSTATSWNQTVPSSSSSQTALTCSLQEKPPRFGFEHNLDSRDDPLAVQPTATTQEEPSDDEPALYPVDDWERPRSQLQPRPQMDAEDTTVTASKSLRVWRENKRIVSQNLAEPSVKADHECYEKEDSRLMIQSAHTIQKLWKRFQAMSEHQRLRFKGAAAQSIQAQWRCHVARRQFLHLRKATRLVQTQRRNMATALVEQRRPVVDVERHNVAAAIRIQTMWRTHCRRVTMLRRSRSRKAAKDIQKLWRTHQRIKCCRIERRALMLRRAACAVKIQRSWHIFRILKIQKATTIQNAWRGKMASRCVHLLRVAHAAATLVQSQFRRHQSRARFQEQEQAACRIQALYRSFIARSEQELEHIKREIGATKVQSAWRAYLTYTLFCRTIRSLTQIQSTSRGYIVRRNVEKMIAACEQIQSHWLSYKLRQRSRENRTVLYKQRFQSATTIQHFYKVCCAVSLLQRLKRRFMSAKKIQTAWRRYWSRATFVRSREAACVVQNAHRGSLARVTADQVSAARSIQSAWRGKSCRDVLIQSILSAVTVQKVARRYIVRRDIKRWLAAAELIQYQWSFYCRKEICRARRKEILAYYCLSSVRIQRVWRCHRAIQILRSKVVEKRSAVIVIQTWWRCRSRRQIFQAACKIQMTLRAFAARVELQRRLEGVEAQSVGATKIQSLWRTHTCRGSFLRCMIALKRVQALSRCFLVQRDLAKQATASKLLQRQWLQYKNAQNCRIHRRALISLRSQNAAKIQKAWRMFRLLSRLTMLRDGNRSARSIQTKWRSYWSRAQFVKRREAVSSIQRLFRALLLPDDYSCGSVSHTDQSQSVSDSFGCDVQEECACVTEEGVEVVPLFQMEQYGLSRAESTSFASTASFTIPYYDDISLTAIPEDVSFARSVGKQEPQQLHHTQNTSLFAGSIPWVDQVSSAPFPDRTPSPSLDPIIGPVLSFTSAESLH